MSTRDAARAGLGRRPSESGNKFLLEKVSFIQVYNLIVRAPPNGDGIPSPGQLQPSWSTAGELENVGKALENIGKHRKSSENIGKPWKAS